MGGSRIDNKARILQHITKRAERGPSALRGTSIGCMALQGHSHYSTSFSSTVRQLELAPMRRRRYANLSLEQTPEEGGVFVAHRVGDVVDSSMALLE